MPIDSRNARVLVVPIQGHREIGPDTFLLSFEAPALTAAVLPGQFLMISFPLLLDPLLPRPFAVYNVRKDCVEVLYKRVGKGTDLLSRMQPKDRIRVLGPLGNSYRLTPAAGTVLVIAGGMGIASVHFLLRRLLHGGREVTLLYGAARKKDLIPVEQGTGVGLDLQTATEDGEEGFKGTVCELLAQRLQAQGRSQKDYDAAYACGPPAMLEETARILAIHGIPAQFSLESRMACGYGVCQGCVISMQGNSSKGQPPHRKVCVDGPIFDPADVRWETLHKCF